MLQERSMLHAGPTPRVGEIVSALSRFAPQSLADVKARHPDQEILFRPGEVLGNAPISISCELALELLSHYGGAAGQTFKRMRRRLRASWWFDLVAKLAATSGASATVAAFLDALPWYQGVVGGLVALVGSGCGLIFSLLQRDETGVSLTGDYNKLIEALVEAEQQQRALRILCPVGSGRELEDALKKTNEVARVLNEMEIRYG
jgi:hypothetical protein